MMNGKEEKAYLVCEVRVNGSADLEPPSGDSSVLSSGRSRPVAAPLVVIRGKHSPRNEDDGAVRQKWHSS